MPILPTRTLNPLPFQDLEPHRFEDLVRQLAYDLRRWKSLEATGRSGADEGVDIRGIELFQADQAEAEENVDEPIALKERLWIFQCKREKEITPKKMRAVIVESLSSLEVPPHGFVISIASDISKKTRDVFREEMIARGIQEWFIWARGELEDMLFQPKNDRLLFAYFNLSLNPRRQSISTSIRSKIAKKKQLEAIIGDSELGKLVLIRDPSDTRYPNLPLPGENEPSWFYCRAVSVRSPDCLTILSGEYLAATTVDGTGWDMIPSHNVTETTNRNELNGLRNWWGDNDDYDKIPGVFWNEYISETDRAVLKEFRFICLDRILATDPLGDNRYPMPHIFVEFNKELGPFEKRIHHVLVRSGFIREKIDLELSETRTVIFPSPLPVSLDLPPKNFDHTGQETVSISGASRLKTVLSIFQDKKIAQEKQRALPRISQEAENPLLAFWKWRREIAHPVFNTFVEYLRADGHTSWVAIRTSEPLFTGYGRLEFIELKFAINEGGSLANPTYRRSGRVTITFYERTKIRLETSPAENSSSRSPRDIVLDLESATQERMENEILVVLERIGIGKDF